MLPADQSQTNIPEAVPRLSRRGAPRTGERQLRAEGYSWVAGVDEAGRGPLAGPVVAAAVIMPADCRVPYVVDSKLLTGPQREYLYEQIVTTAVTYAIGIVSPRHIDATNILRAAQQAMQQGLAGLSPPSDFALIDGPFCLPISLSQRAIIGGDRKCYCIAAASIVAKVYRDRLMDYLARLYPHYGFEHNRGYATPGHLQALQEYGPCPVHRYSFQPIQQRRLQLEKR